MKISQTIILCGLAVTLLMSCRTSQNAWEKTKGSLKALENSKASYIAVISDGDFYASTYANGKLTPQSATFTDALTIFDISQKPIKTSTVSVPNSVVGTPDIMALSADGRFAYVVETIGQRGNGATNMKELALGGYLTSIDLRSLENPVVVDQVKVGPRPESVRINREGSVIAIASNSDRKAFIQLVTVEDGNLGEIINFDIELLSKGQVNLKNGVPKVSFVDWHPSGDYLAANLYRQNQVVFFKVETNENDRLSLMMHGQPVRVGKDPFVGRFTPNGDYYITADWGRNFDATTVEGRLPKKSSELTVVRFSHEGKSNAQLHHTIVDKATSDRSSEGLAISPDGRFVATVNMRETALPESSQRFTLNASISFFTFDSKTGNLEKVNDYPFEGVLPEGGTFDSGSSLFLASVFEYKNSGTPLGGIEMWSIQEEPSPSLVYKGRLDVPHGAHGVAVK